MKTEKNILIAFLLNIFFSIFEFFGGMMTNSVAIMSDAIHDFGDALSIGISFILEKISKKKPNEVYTYGYARYSILGALITTVILTIGSILVILGAIGRIIHPVEINYDGMIIFAIFGVIVNFLAAWFTKEGESVNQKAVNLHMLEDVLGWIVVLIGSILMKFTDIRLLDSIMCILVAFFILIHTFDNLKDILDIFLIKMPKDIHIEDVKKHLLEIDGVEDIHHIHIWTIDGVNNYATMHVVTKMDASMVKKEIKEEMKELGIFHTTIEIEAKGSCDSVECDSKMETAHHHHH